MSPRMLRLVLEELRATKQESLNLRFRNATGQLDNNAEIRKVKRQIARRMAGAGRAALSAARTRNSPRRHCSTR